MSHGGNYGHSHTDRYTDHDDDERGHDTDRDLYQDFFGTTQGDTHEDPDGDETHGDTHGDTDSDPMDTPLWRATAQAHPPDEPAADGEPMPPVSRSPAEPWSPTEHWSPTPSSAAAYVPPVAPIPPPPPAPASYRPSGTPAEAYPAAYPIPPAGHQSPPGVAAQVHAPVAGPVPRPEDLLLPGRSGISAEPATWGWRGRLNRTRLVKAKPAADELAARQAIRDIQRTFSRPMTVVVVQPKGGAGKTPTTICLSAAFGAHRGGYVVGWDDNETRGTLAVRVSNLEHQRATVWDLLGELDAFERFDARVGDLGYYVRAQPDAYFDALVSDDNPANMAQIGEDAFHRLHRVLQRFYRLIVVDTGNNVRSPNWQAAVNAADLVVVVSTYQRDVGYSGSWVLDHLAQTGREGLARNAITILTAAEPTTDDTVRRQLIGHFAARTRAVLEVPYDAEIAHGGPIRWADLSRRSHTAWIHAGAAIVNALAEHDERTLAAGQP
jgi:MinD-like ATPase involved in chromosome partitioning or flagellar assembly